MHVVRNIKLFTKLKGFFKIIFGQGLIQILGLVIGFVLVRSLSKDDYKIYTVLMSIQAMMATLSGSGIMIGFQKIAGGIWNDNWALSSLLKTARHIRERILILSIIVSCIYGYAIFYQQGVSAIKSLSYLLLIILVVYPEIQKSFLRAALLLRKEVTLLQITSVIQQGLRALLIFIYLLVFNEYFEIYIVLLISVCSSWLSNVYIQKKSLIIFPNVGVIEPQYKNTLYDYIKKVWHNSLFFTFKGQVSILLIGLFGSGENLANLGALTRFSLAFAFITSVINLTIIPHFGRERTVRKLKSLYILSIVSWILFSLLTLILLYFMQNRALSLLGSQYSGLNHEFMLVIVNGLIGIAIGLFQGLNYSKGWMKYNTYFSIPLDILSIVVGALLFDVTKLSGVLQMSIFTSCIGLTLILSNTIQGFYCKS